MANPQKENGSTDIANELLEAIYSFGFNGTDLAIILCILRYTYGFHRKEHELSIKFISNATKRHKIEVSKSIKKLIASEVLIEYEKPSFASTREIGINKNYSKWNTHQLVKILTGSENTNTTVSEITNSPVSENTNQETKNIKLKNKLNIYNVDSSNQRERFEALWNLYPRKEGKENAFKKYQRICKRVDDETIKRGILNYIEEIQKKGTEKKYIKMGSTWFNGECWNDEYEDTSLNFENRKSEVNKIWQ